MPSTFALSDLERPVVIDALRHMAGLRAEAATFAAAGTEAARAAGDPIEVRDRKVVQLLADSQRLRDVADRLAAPDATPPPEPAAAAAGARPKKAAAKKAAARRSPSTDDVIGDLPDTPDDD